MNFSRRNHGAIQRRASIEFTEDAMKYRRILLLRVRMEGGHHAAVAQFLGVNPYVTNGDHAARPLALFEIRNVRDEDIGAQAAMIDVQVARCAVRSHQQRQDVKGFGSRYRFKGYRLTRGFMNKLERLGRVPAMAVDGGRSAGGHAALKAQQLRPR